MTCPKKKPEGNKAFKNCGFMITVLLRLMMQMKRAYTYKKSHLTITEYNTEFINSEQ